MENLLASKACALIMIIRSIPFGLELSCFRSEKRGASGGLVAFSTYSSEILR